MPEVLVISVASHYRRLSLHTFPVVCSALPSGIRPMESFSGDTEENTEGIPGEIICHAFYVRILRRESKSFTNMSYQNKALCLHSIEARD